MIRKRIFTIFSIFLFGISTLKGADEIIDIYLPADKFLQGSMMKFSDGKIYGPSGYISGWTNQFGIKQTHNTVSLFIDPSSLKAQTPDFSLELDLKMSLKDNQNNVIQNQQGQDTFNIKLAIDYKTGENYKQRDAYVFSGAHLIYVEIDQVNLSGADTSALSDIVYLRSAMNIERYYKMKNQQVKNLKHQYQNADNELLISWQAMSGAEKYDLEWTWVDNYDHSGGQMQRQSQSEVFYDFDKNSQRVRVKSNQYRIPAVFEEGYMVYRVRPLGIGGSNYNKILFGPWSAGDAGKVSSAGSAVFVINQSIAHESDKKNWLYRAEYREEGHNIAAVDYYDGLFYKRQHVQQLKTENDVLVTEDYYDHQGRLAVNVMPAPTAEKNPHPNLKYYDNFNQNQQGDPYSKKDFDDLTNCTPSAPAMGKNSGAAKYYSSNNSGQNPFKDHLPKAEGYPFAQRQYVPDKSEDLRKQGKVGETFQLGQGHSIQYFYGTPGQAELDRLFGSEAGYAKHYRKKVFADENGQVRVRYYNRNGDLIAKALAGDSPPMLDELPDDQVESRSITEYIVRDHQLRRGNKLVASRNIAVATEGTQYSFNYTLNPASLERIVCGDETICYDGIYDLLITIRDECDQTVVDTAVQIGSIQGIDETCNDNEPITISFSSGPLSKGKYQVTKRLSLNEEALQKYLDLFARKECIQAKWEAIYDANLDDLDTSSCKQGCGDSFEAKQEYTVTTKDGKEVTQQLSKAEQQELASRKNNLCGEGTNSCRAAYDAMLMDVSPDGQYGLYYDTVNNRQDPSAYPLSVFNENNKLPDPDAFWRNPDGHYMTDTGTIAYIYLHEIDGQQGIYNDDSVFTHKGRLAIRPENLLYFSLFLEHWEDSWAEALVAYHPEYPYYEYCSQHTASNNYDSYLLATGKFTEAADSGYVDANGNVNLLDSDPFFQQYPALKNEMRNELDNYMSVAGKTLSMTDLAIAMHNGCAGIQCQSQVDIAKIEQCLNANSPLFQNKPAAKQTDEWASLRSLYTAKKLEIIQRERHQYAINNGVYNGCIGVDPGDKDLEGQRLSTDFDVQVSDLSSNTPCSACDSCYMDKTKRFPDGKDVFDYVDGVEETVSDSLLAIQAKQRAEFKLKQNCDKCPIEMSLQTFLTQLSSRGNFTGSQDATNAIASCDFKNGLGSTNAFYYNWSADVQGRELTGTISAGGLDLCTIRLYDSTERQIVWDDIMMFTCLQHTTNTNNYNNTGTRNFKVRAITDDREVFWLEGVNSCIDLSACDVERFCTKKAVADDLKPIFNKVFGFFPSMREELIDRGYQQWVNQNIDTYQGTDLITNMEVTNDMTSSLKQQHAEPNRSFYEWKVTGISADTGTLTAGIYGKNGCSFTFEMLDEDKKFGETFIIRNILLNHPALTEKACDMQSFVLEVRSLNLNLENLGDIQNVNISDIYQLGEVFYIKVTNDCYVVGECCPPGNCPNLTANFNFSDGNSAFGSDLPYSDTTRNTAYYSIAPMNNFINPGGYQLDQVQFQNINPGNLNINNPSVPGQIQQQDEAGDPAGGQQPDTLKITGEFEYFDQKTFNPDQLNLNLNNRLIVSQLVQMNMPELDTGLLQNISGNIAGGQAGDVYSGLLRNSYLIFNAGERNNPVIWEQTISVTPGEQYNFTCLVKAVSPEAGTEPAPGFSLVVDDQNRQLSAQNAKGNWKELRGTFEAPSGNSVKVSLVFNTPADHLRWGVDDIRVKAQTCRDKMACCPPVSPEIPEGAFGNPCVAKKKMIAKANADLEFKVFLEDTISGIEAAYREEIMQPVEKLTMNYSDNSYDYTLVYYDQAGNMVKTVPPKGFNPVPASQVDQVHIHRTKKTGNPVYPDHTLVSRYEYDSYDNLVKKQTPDGGTFRLWYDQQGRLLATQSEAQAANGNIYSYVLYDELGRDIESGEVVANASMPQSVINKYEQFESWVKQQPTRRDVMRKYFDQPKSSKISNYFTNGQKNLRMRVATVTFEMEDDNDPATYDFATHFSYDTHGNVDVLKKEINSIPGNHKVKTINYDYDVIGNNVHEIVYQPGEQDQFIHHYEYDEGNRLETVRTSRNGLFWEEEAKIYYYPHGKMARVELGENKVQGMDYVYTLQGWLKGVNADRLDPSADIAGDGSGSGIFGPVSRDAISMAFDYYDGDYEPIGANNQFNTHLGGNLGNSSPGQYTGNARQRLINNAGLKNVAGMAAAYRYDQLNRLVESEVYLKNQQNWQSTNDFNTAYSYDPNGNTLSLTRFGSGNKMDELGFNYQPGNNRLDYVSDQVSAQAYPGDIDNQQSGNYSYDGKGRLKQDLAGEVQNINWSYRDYMRHFVKADGTTVYNDYDAAGKRVVQTIDAPGTENDMEIYYIRGADDEIMATYVYDVSKDSLYLRDQYLYANSRIGVYKVDEALGKTAEDHLVFKKGKKRYELRDNLNTVVAVISDLKQPDTTQGGATRYMADIRTASAYYPYGSMFPGTNAGLADYEHGYQGKEEFDQLYGEGNAYNFGARIYDPRLGRWLSVDPKAKDSPENSPYIAMGNDPVNRIDKGGKQDEDSQDNGEKQGNAEKGGESTNKDEPNPAGPEVGNTDNPESKSSSTADKVGNASTKAGQAASIFQFLQQYVREHNFKTQSKVLKIDELIEAAEAAGNTKAVKYFKSLKESVETGGELADKLDKAGTLLSAISQMAGGTTQTKRWRGIEGLVGGRVAIAIGSKLGTKGNAALVVGDVVMNYLGGPSVSGTISSSITAASTVAESVFTGDTKGLRKFYRQASNGDRNVIFKYSVKIGDYITENYNKGNYSPSKFWIMLPDITPPKSADTESMDFELGGM